MVGLYIGLGIGAVALVVIAVLIWRAVKAKNLKALQIAIAAEHLERIMLHLTSVTKTIGLLLLPVELP